MLVQHNADDHVLVTSEGPADAKAIAFPNDAMRLGVLAVDFDLAAFAGALGFRAGLEEAGDIQPDVEANVVAHMRISIFAFAFSVVTNAWVSV